MESFLPKRTTWKAVLKFLIWTIAFGLAYTQAPLYYSNQNQYFLHGLAKAGRGSLDEDWLANTTDPTPVFTAIVHLTDRFGVEQLFYVYQILTLGVYFQSMLVIFESISRRPVTDLGRLIFAALLFITHAALPRMLSVRWFGVDYLVYLQSGLAAQYVLRFGLQPSVAGVFLIAAVAAFLRELPAQAVLLACLAAAFHPTYLLGAGLLTVGFVFAFVSERRFGDALRIAVLAFLLALPIAIDSAVRFRPTTAENFAHAERLLAHFRIPHHTSVKVWFDRVAGLQLIWFSSALLLIRRHRIVPVLLIIAGLSLALTIVQVISDSDSLALLFPWRTSAFLLPVATAIVLTRLTDLVLPKLERIPDRAAAFCYWVIRIMIAGGIAINLLGWGYRTNDSELPLLEWVKSNAQPGDLYLIPVNVPRLGTGKPGAFASDFTPPPRPDQPNQIAMDLQRFRLYTGAPIFVDFKSVPYKDVEVLEWKRRLDWTAGVYAENKWDAEELLQSGITHVVTLASQPINQSRFKLVHNDEYYHVYLVR